MKYFPFFAVLSATIVSFLVYQDQMRKFYSGEGYIQDIFPDLSPGAREFILTGITDEEWEVHIGND